MDSRRGVSRARRNRPMGKSLSRAVAWLLVFCMCMANMNSAAFAAEIASASNAAFAATPSDAVATGSNAMEILMPEETISGGALQEEAVRAISEGNEFKFSSEIKVLKDSEGRDEGYDKLFRGRRSFVLFADNGKGGRIQGDNPNAYGYILVQVDEKEYEAFEKEAGTARATGSNATSSDATGSNASERSWAITGGEELVFLYINADDGSVTFTLNIENLQADDIVVPSYSELKKEREEAKAESEAEEEEENPAAQPAEDGNEAGGNAGSSGGGSGSGSADGGENGDGGQSAGAEEPGSGDGSAAGETSGDENGAGHADGSGEDQENGNGGGSGSENGSGENGSADGADQGSGSGSGSGGGQGTEKPDSSDEGQENGQGAEKPGGSGEGQENGNGGGSGSENGSGENGSADGADQGSGNGSGSGGGQDAGKPDGSDKDQSAGSGDSQDAGNHGNAGSGSSDKGGSADKGDTGSGSSDKGGSADKGNAGSGSSDKGGSADKGNAGSGSSDKGGNADKGSSGTAKLSKSSYDVPVVMGPNPDAEFEEDELGDISFDEWQEMMEEAEEEEEEEDEDSGDYIEEAAMSYEDGDGTSYLGMSVLPAVTATVKKTEKTSGIAKLFRKNRSVEAPAVVMAGTAALSDVSGITVTSAYKQIEALENGNYKLHLGLSGGGKRAFDIVLVIDQSSSMKQNVGGIFSGSKIAAVKKALCGGNGKGGFIRKIKAEYPESRFAVVGYGRKLLSQSKWTGDQNSVIDLINSISANEPDTNYEAGLWGADQCLEARGNSSNIPIVIFLTDGVPTAYCGDAGSFDGGTAQYVPSKSSPNEEIGDATMSAAKGFNQALQDKGGLVYTVGFAVPSEIQDNNDGNWSRPDSAYKYYKPAQYLYAISGGITEKGSNGKWIVTEEKPDNSVIVNSGDNASEELEKAFENISTSLKMTNVVIKDRLSRFVQFLGTSGNPADTTNAKVYKITKSWNGSANREAIHDFESLSFMEPDESGCWGIELRFGKNYEFDPNAEYELEFEIKVNRDALDTITPEEKVEGGKNTDYEDGNISEGKSGAPSNLEASYSYGSIGEIHYPQPVFPVPDKPTVPDLDYQKSIEKNQSGNYTLTLDVTSPVEETITEPKKIPAEIVFLIDRSGSMGDRLGQKTRQEIVNEALEKIIPELCTEEYDLHIAGYQFSAKDFIVVTKPDVEQTCGWTNNQQAVLNGLKIKKANGGTMPAEGLRQALTTLKNGYSGNSGKDNVKKYFVFLTDGEPDGERYDASYDVIDAMNLNGITFYAVGISKDASISYLNGVVTHAEDMGADVKGGVKKGDTEEGIKTVFEEIKQEIAAEIGSITYGFKGVRIQDTLSEYADLVSSEDEIQILKNGKPLSAEESEAAKPVVDINGKTVTVTFSPDYELEKDAKYSISFDVKPSNYAMEEYRKNMAEDPDKPYGDTVGDGGTGSESAGLPGFHSNKEATLTYLYGSYSNEDDPIYYQHPVLQVPQTGSFTVQKIVENIEDNETPLADGQKFIVNIDQMIDGEAVPFSSVALTGNGEKSPSVQADGEQKFRISEAVPMEFTLKEIRVLDENAEGSEQDVTGERFDKAENTLTVKSGDRLVVQVVNTFNHKGYFHSADRVTNTTKGDTESPFTSDGAARQAAEDQPKAESAKKKVEIEEEEGEPLV